MRLYLLFFIATLCIIPNVRAQQDEDIYRSQDNPMYWKNRPPDKDYWQQDVHYKINAWMHEEDNRIAGDETLTYWNNSPDTLRFVYFHLFQNAFIKGSHFQELELANKTKPRLGKNEAVGLGIIIDKLQVDGLDVKTELDNTIMKVYLPKPLLPGGHVVFTSKFNTWYDHGSARRRMQMYDAWGFMHYNGCQWFPKICVYDRMHGWDTYQHLNKEFYGDFGEYDVTLDFPSNYILEATGVLQNRREVLPDELRAKLDIKNFANKKWNEPPSVIIPYKKGERKQWHFIANNVHDFAFTADPSYRIGTAYWNGIECVAIVQEPHASGWQNAPEYIAKIIKTFSDSIGMYGYPKIVAADANDGMEYPMITMDGGRDPGYRSLLVHEIGHNWFYGMLGSNETYRAAMDEGFTQFLTSLGLRSIDGDIQVEAKPRSKYRQYFSEPVNVMDRNVLNTYTFDALNHNEVQLNTISDDFNSGLNHGGGYREVYFKTASMLYNLQYVLGDSLFHAAMHHYFEQWKFAHPYFEDFRASVIQFTHVDLSWFFDEWFETTKTLDYSVDHIKRLPGNDSFAIHFSRRGEMQMPIDFTVTAKNGMQYNYYIPNTWFEKSTTAILLPKWYGWGKLNPTYTAHVEIPSGIKSVAIDTTCRLADKDMVDNYKTRGLPLSPDAVTTRFDGGVANQFNRRTYSQYIRPDLWWNPIDGAKIGAHFEGNYIYSLYNIDASVWFNTHLLRNDDYISDPDDGYKKYAPLNYTFNYLSPLVRNMPKLQLQINSRFMDGLWYHRAGFNWLFDDDNTMQLYGQVMWRPNTQDYDYLIDPTEWSSNDAHYNPSLNAAWTHRYNYFKGSGRYTFSVRTPLLTGYNDNSFNYSYGQFEAVNYNYFGKLELRTRAFGRFGTGNRIPSESALFMAGVDPEQMMEDKYTNSVGFEPESWDGISRYDVNHLQEGGGLGLRGYTGYFAPDERNGQLLEGYKGRSGAAVNVEADVENYIPLKPRLTRNWLHVDAYFFGDAGIMELEAFNALQTFYDAHPTTSWGSVHTDAGVGFAFTIKNWGVFDKARPLTIRLDLPLFLNRPPYNDPVYGTVRYVVGVNRSF